MKYVLTINGQEFLIEKKQDGYYYNNDKILDLLSFKTLSDFDSVPIEDGQHIWLKGQDFTISLIQQSLNSTADEKQDGDIFSPLNGVVQQVACKQGEKVNKGDLLITIEAMKMLYPLYAPFDAIIENLDASVRQAVKSKQLLIKLKKIDNSNSV